MSEEGRAEHPKSRSLFHYTTSDGLLGIIKSDSLFASHYSFLNDSSEGAVLRELLLPRLEAETRRFVPRLIEAGILKRELLATKGEDYYREEVGRMFKSMTSATNKTAPFFITSFCIHEEGTDHYRDGLLSQWRGYARGGFAIEFDEFGIDELAKKERETFRYQGIMTEAVRYRDFEDFVRIERFDGYAATMFRAVFNEVLPKAQKKLIEILGERSTEEYAHPYLSTVPFLKNSGFEEEREYRIVALCNRPGVMESEDQRRPKEFCFRSRPNGGIIPYIRLFETLAGDLPIKSIVIGPHPHQESQIEAVQLILDEYEVKCAIRASRIPFRE